MDELLAGLFSHPAVREALSDRARLAAMAAFEAALANAEAETGVIPGEAAAAITAAADGFRPDVAALAEASRPAGNPAIPFVAAFTAACPDTGRGYVHWGATSQDLLDTATVLQLRAARAPIAAEIDRLAAALADLAERHRDTPMLGRTLLQPALPITAGFKAARWLDAVGRCGDRLLAAFDDAAMLQFGGAVGTLAALGDDAEAVRAALARRLDLAVAPVTWHDARDRFARVGCESVVMLAGLARIAHDIALLMQAEVGEAREPAAPGRGGSSTMPQKRNPVAAPAVIAAFHAAQGALAGLLSAQLQEHERGVGGWHAEWLTLPQIVELTAGALLHLRETIEGLEVDTDRMVENLHAGQGTATAEALMMRLAGSLGRGAAKALVGELSAKALSDGVPLREVAAGDSRVTAHLGPADIAAALDPGNYLGTAPRDTDAVVARHRRNRKQGESS